MSKQLLLTQTEFARRLKVSPQTINYLIDKGRLASTDKNGRKMIDWNSQKDIYQRIQNRGDRSKSIPDSEDTPEAELPSGKNDGKINNIADARLELERYKAMKAKEEYLRLTGQLILLEEVEEAWVEVASALKKSILSLPARIGPLLAGESNPHKATLMLKTELIKCLQDTVEKYQPSTETPPFIIDEPDKVKKKVVKKKVKKKIVKKKVVKKKAKKKIVKKKVVKKKAKKKIVKKKVKK